MLNIWWPILFLVYGFNVVQNVISWGSVNNSTFIVSIIVIVGLLVADLLVRFLDKASLYIFYSAEILLMVRSVWNAIDMFVAANYASESAQFEQTGMNMVDSVFSIVESSVQIYAGLVFAISCITAVIQIVIAIVTIIYIQKRKDLFLYSEKELKKLYEE